MLTYGRFEDLPVWQEAIRLAEGCEDFFLTAKDRISFSKRDQLDRASLCVSNTIAEGFERGTTNELLSFLYIARGSAGEVRSMLGYFESRSALKDLQLQNSNLKSLAKSRSRQLRARADALPQIPGPRAISPTNSSRKSKPPHEPKPSNAKRCLARALAIPSASTGRAKHGPSRQTSNLKFRSRSHH